MRLEPGNHWQDAARETYVDDIEKQRYDLISNLLLSKPNQDVEEKIHSWQKLQKQPIQRWQSLITDLRQASALEFSMLTVALKELRYLVQSSAENAES